MRLLVPDVPQYPPDPPLRRLIRLAGLVALLAGVIPELHLNRSGNHAGLIVWLAVATAGWVTMMGTRDRNHTPLNIVALVVLGVCGGALAPDAPVAIGFGAAVAVSASMVFDLPLALMIGAVEPLSHLISAAVLGQSLLPVVGSAAAVLGGVIIGSSRIQVARRAEQQALMQVERAKAEVEHERADLLAERNRLAREIHDVLAHTLGAVSVQVEALDAVVGDADEAALRERLAVTRGLVVQGLDEARRAVTALRDDAPPLAEQLKGLCATTGVELVTSGSVRTVEARGSLALYRVVQESLTNAAKHAPGAHVTVLLRFGEGEVEVRVVNGSARGVLGALAASGGGYGLQGMRERVLLLGGSFEAEPLEDGGWSVRATVPG